MSLLDKTMDVTEVPQYGFFSLFAATDEGDESVLLTPPSMDTVTDIGLAGCNSMYIRRSSLKYAADMPSLVTIGVKGCVSMYEDCTSITSAANMPSLITIEDSGCSEMYYGCIFDMSNDGSTLNFAFPTPPVTAGETTYSTAHDVAQWMGNTKGF